MEDLTDIVLREARPRHELGTDRSWEDLYRIITRRNAVVPGSHFTTSGWSSARCAVGAPHRGRACSSSAVGPLAGPRQAVLDGFDEVGAQFAGRVMPSTDPTSTARWMSWTASNSAARAPNISARTVVRVASNAARGVTRSRSPAAARRSRSAFTRGSRAVRASTSPENTTAAAGAPPMTEARAPRRRAPASLR
jgi:hypothetical protein